METGVGKYMLWPRWERRRTKIKGLVLHTFCPNCVWMAACTPRTATAQTKIVRLGTSPFFQENWEDSNSRDFFLIIFLKRMVVYCTAQEHLHTAQTQVIQLYPVHVHLFLLVSACATFAPPSGTSSPALWRENFISLFFYLFFLFFLLQVIISPTHRLCWATQT